MENQGSNNKKEITITKRKKAKRDFSLWPVFLVLTILVVACAGPLTYYAYLNHEFNTFMRDLRDSFIQGQKFNGFTAEYDGKQAEIDGRSGSWIFTELNFVGFGKKCEIEEAEDPFILDFGDGSTLLLASSTTEGRNKRTVKALYVEYTYPNGKKYSYKTEETEFHYMLDPIINYYLSD